MPNRDGTGPTGQGINAGRCAGRNGSRRPGGRGFGARRQGRSRRSTQRVPSLDASRDRSWISDQLNSLQAAIQGLTARFKALDKE